MAQSCLLLFLSVAVFAVQLCQGFVTVESVLDRAQRALNDALNGLDNDRAVLFAPEPVAIKVNLSSIIKEMDLAPKLMMYEFDKKFHYTYENMVHALSTSYFAVRKSNLGLERGDKFIKDIEDWEFSTPPRSLKVDIANWIKRLIGKEFTELFSLDAKHNDLFLTYISKSLTTMSKKCRLLHPNLKTRNLVNVPVVVYPTLKDENFYVYRIFIDNWVSCSSDDKKGGLTGDVQRGIFRPRKEIIQYLSDDVKAKFLKKVNDKYSKSE